MQYRPYQQRVHDRTIDFLKFEKGHGLVVAECSAGKSLLMAGGAEWAYNNSMRPLIVADRAKLLEQNSTKIKVPHGVVSAGLKRFEYNQDIVVGGIQTIFDKSESLGRRDIILIDECEAVGNNWQSDSRYHQLLRQYPFARVVGYTATPYTLQEGQLSWATPIEEVTYKELLDNGYCTPLTNKICDTPDYLNDVELVAKEYNLGQLSGKLSDPALIDKTVRKIIQYINATRRKKILIFCVSVDHALAVGFALNAYGEKNVDVVHGKQSEERRASVYSNFENSNERQILINVELLTKGADFPCIDCIVCLRPTESMRLWMQILGRGIRLYAGKLECLLLDFSGNLQKFGTLGNPIWKYLGSTKKKVGKAQKVCPQCESAINIGRSQCPSCDYIFLKEDVQKELKHDAEADINSDMTKAHSLEKWYPVNHILYSRNIGKDGKPDTLKVNYISGRTNLYSYICFDHPRGSWANKQALLWAKMRGDIPESVEEALEICEKWKRPKAVATRPQKGQPQFKEIYDYEW